MRMRTRLYAEIFLLSLAFMVWRPPVTQAQQEGEAPALQGGASSSGALSAVGGSPADISVTPVANAPFQAVVQVERTTIQPNGLFTSLKSTRTIARDSNGRTHDELRAMQPVSANHVAQVQHIHIYDPNSQTSIDLNPRQKTFWTAIVDHVPETESRKPATAAPASQEEGEEADDEEASVPASEYPKHEDLGSKEIEGITVHGTCDIQSVPADDHGSGGEILITDESWYSEDLKMNLVIKHDDPLTGSISLKVTRISRTDPDASLFEVPVDYKSIAPKVSSRQ